jgi:murein DD-endopeptidase MepM/ murein hydrolase activator NlpD
MRTMYAHLSRYNVIPGEEVHRGDVLAFSGATGAVTAPHLHFEVRVGSSPVNPFPYLTRSAMLQKTAPDFPF